jgi:hypothetical protein
VVPRYKTGDAFADFDDDAASLMPKDSGKEAFWIIT